MGKNDNGIKKFNINIIGKYILYIKLARLEIYADALK